MQVDISSEDLQPPPPSPRLSWIILFSRTWTLYCNSFYFIFCLSLWWCFEIFSIGWTHDILVQVYIFKHFNNWFWLNSFIWLICQLLSEYWTKLVHLYWKNDAWYKQLNAINFNTGFFVFVYCQRLKMFL